MEILALVDAGSSSRKMVNGIRFIFAERREVSYDDKKSILYATLKQVYGKWDEVNRLMTEVIVLLVDKYLLGYYIGEQSHMYARHFDYLTAAIDFFHGGNVDGLKDVQGKLAHTQGVAFSAYVTLDMVNNRIDRVNEYISKVKLGTTERVLDRGLYRSLELALNDLTTSEKVTVAIVKLDHFLMYMMGKYGVTYEDEMRLDELKAVVDELYGTTPSDNGRPYSVSFKGDTITAVEGLVDTPHDESFTLYGEMSLAMKQLVTVTWGQLRKEGGFPTKKTLSDGVDPYMVHFEFDSIRVYKGGIGQEGDEVNVEAASADGNRVMLTGGRVDRMRRDIQTPSGTTIVRGRPSSNQSVAVAYSGSTFLNPSRSVFDAGPVEGNRATKGAMREAEETCNKVNARIKSEEEEVRKLVAPFVNEDPTHINYTKGLLVLLSRFHDLANAKYSGQNVA